MPIALSRQKIGNDLTVYGACACRLVVATARRRNCNRQGHNRKRALLHGLRSRSAALTRQVTADMGVEHAVSESVVVPGLKLTDHTFQVRSPPFCLLCMQPVKPRLLAP